MRSCSCRAWRIEQLGAPRQRRDRLRALRGEDGGDDAGAAAWHRAPGRRRPRRACRRRSRRRSPLRRPAAHRARAPSASSRRCTALATSFAVAASRSGRCCRLPADVRLTNAARRLIAFIGKVGRSTSGSCQVGTRLAWSRMRSSVSSRICALWFCSSLRTLLDSTPGSASAATATPSLSLSLNCRRLAMALSAPRIGPGADDLQQILVGQQRRMFEDGAGDLDLDVARQLLDHRERRVDRILQRLGHDLAHLDRMVARQGFQHLVAERADLSRSSPANSGTSATILAASRSRTDSSSSRVRMRSAWRGVARFAATALAHAGIGVVRQVEQDLRAGHRAAAPLCGARRRPDRWKGAWPARNPRRYSSSSATPPLAPCFT